MSRFCHPVLALIGLAPIAHSFAPPRSQGGVPPGEPTITPTLIEAWVWPAWGNDSTGAINDPAQPYRSIQDAIDDLHAFILDAEDPLLEGLVWCMPGLYGPASVHGTHASDDAFPIVMKHRVHVKGVSARRCVIRGIPTSHPEYNQQLHPVSLPLYDYDCVGAPPGAPSGELVLVTFSESHKYQVALGAPTGIGWYTYAAEVDEVLEGFTFQGGGVQVSFDMGQNHSYPLSGRISNCIFDMRHMPSASPTPIDGPEVGLLIESAFTQVNGFCGYWNQRVHVANNTFIMAEYGGVPAQWKNDARFWAVGILNYCDPESQYLYPFGFDWDVNWKFRGMGNPGIQNNLFRTKPSNLATGVGPMAMV